MARDKGLEALLSDDLGPLQGLTEKGMFGGWVWMLRGNLLCAARSDGMLFRLGRDRDGWALELAGVTPMFSGERRMYGWVRASSEACAEGDRRERLLRAALDFVGALPPK